MGKSIRYKKTLFGNYSLVFLSMFTLFTLHYFFFQNFISKTVDTYGRIDCLVNNAGISKFTAKTIGNISTEMYNS